MPISHSTRFVLAAVTVVTALAGTLVARQNTTKTPTFEVASVKRAPSPGNGPIAIRLGGLTGNRWLAENATLLMLIRSAYAPNYQMQGQIVGGPPWLQTDRFNVNAKAEGMPTIEEARVMVQQLLAERFKLTVRRDTRELPMYALVLARSDGRLGREMKTIDVDCNALREAQKQAGPPQFPQFKPGDAPPPCQTMMMMSPTSSRLQSGGTTLAELASMLSQQSGRPVIDRTGLKGYFSVNVEFAREAGVGPLGPLAVAPDTQPGGTAASDIPTIFAALQDQLGLKLEPRREQTDVLSIERAEPPTED